MSNVALHADEIVRRYRSKSGFIEVLKGINLTAELGQWICLTGDSGCGKTTLLRILGLLDRQDGGTLEILGQDIQRTSSFARARIRRLQIGFVFQSYELFPELNAMENVTLPARLAGQYGSKTEDRARALLREMGMEHRLTHRPAELSGGEQQRVAIARAFINHPKLVLADEPTGNLDDKNSGDVMEILRELRDQSNCAIIMVTHSTGLTRFADRAYAIEDGSLNSA